MKYSQGGFHLVAKIIRELKSYIIPYKFKCSHRLKLQHSEFRANLAKDFFLQINFPPMRAFEFIRDHVTFKLPYDFSYHMKTPQVSNKYAWFGMISGKAPGGGYFISLSS